MIKGESCGKLKLASLGQKSMKKHIKKIAEKLTGNLPLRSGIIFLLIAIFMAVLATFLIAPSIFGTTDCDKFLPEKNLVAFAYFDDFQAPENLVKQYPQFADEFNNQVSHIFGLDFASTNNWRGKKAGFALYENTFNTENKLSWAVLLEIDNKEAAKSFLNTFLNQESEEGIKRSQVGKIEVLNPDSKNYKCAIYKNYLICTDKNSTLFDDLQAEKKSIASSADYQRWNAQMPDDSYVKAYFKTEKLAKFLPNYTAFLTENIEIGGFVITENKSSFDLSLFCIKKKQGEEMNAQGKSENLIQLLPYETIAFANGKNTKDTINAALDEISRNDPPLKEFLLGRMRAIMKESYFGSSVSLEQDIFPLFAKDFVFAVLKRDGKIIPLLILNTDDDVFAEEKRKKLISGFEEYASSLTGEIIENTLDNGEVVKEAFPLGQGAEKIEKEIANGIISDLKSDQKELVLGRKNQLLVISNDPEAVKQVINNSDTAPYQRQTAPLVQNFDLKTFSSFDEIFAFDKEAFVYLPEQYQKYVKYFTAISGKVVRIPDSFRIDLRLDF